MADETPTNTPESNEVNLSSVIKEQSQTIETLVDNIQSGVLGQPSGQPIYNVTPQRTAATTNYVLYIAIGLAIWFFMRRKR